MAFFVFGESGIQLYFLRLVILHAQSTGQELLVQPHLVVLQCGNLLLAFKLVEAGRVGVDFISASFSQPRRAAFLELEYELFQLRNAYSHTVAAKRYPRRSDGNGSMAPSA